MRNLWVRFVAWLLGIANARARGSTMGRDFYRLKDQLCRRFGAYDGDDVQHFADRCWGAQDADGCEGTRCRRCGGTGFWSERWVRLERWTLGGRVFHRPAGSLACSVDTALDYLEERGRSVIEGRIEHRDVNYRTSSEARLWLALLFDRRLWWSELKRCEACGWQWRPMLVLQKAVFRSRMIVDRLTPVTCASCERKFINLRVRTAWCRRCAKGWDIADMELPF